MKKNQHNIFLLGIVAFFIMLPMFLSPYHRGNDTEYHVVNIVGLKEQLENNTILNPNLIIGVTAHNFGYGTRLFYPPLSHTFVSTISFVTNDIPLSLKITHFIILFLSGISMYYLSLKLTRNTKVALLSGVIYMLFPYHLTEFYVRDALAESFLFPFLPLIISSIIEWKNGNNKKFYPLFIIGYVGGFLSHFTMMLYFTYFLFAYFLINYKSTLQWKKLKPLLVGALLVTLICCPFFDTMIEHKLFGDYAIFLPNYMAGGIYWATKFISDYFNIFKEFHEFEANYFFDVLTIILLITTLFQFKKIKEHKKYIPILWLGILSIYFSSKYFPWNIMPGFLRMIQFPWRLETFVCLSVSLIAPLCLTLFTKEKQNKYLFCIIPLMILFAYIMLPTKNLVNLCMDPLYKDAGMGWNKEYLPSNTLHNLDYFDTRDETIHVNDENVKVEILKNQVPTLEFEVENIEKSVTLELPRLYYLGYSMQNEKKEKIPFYENDKGFIEVSIPSNGIYTLVYTGTIAYNICRVLSTLTILFCVMYCIWKRGVCFGKN